MHSGKADGTAAGSIPGRTGFPAGLLAGLLPAGMAVVDAVDGSFDRDRLVGGPAGAPDTAFAAELEVLGAAPPGRRLEFARARVCAHVAIAALGRPAGPILLGPHREPAWPAGVVGSITHCAGYRAAAVAPASVLRAVGVDAEPDQRLPAEIGRLVLTDADRAASSPLARFVNWERVAFSARESVFKAWFALTGRGLDFADAALRLEPEDRYGGRFSATIGTDVQGADQLVRACGGPVLHGRFQLVPAPALVLTAVTVRAPSPATAPLRPGSSITHG